MRSRSGPVLLFLFLLPLLTLADLPSCYRARCTHCRIPFIAQMCTQTCNNCPPQVYNGKAVNNAGTSNVVAHGKQIATVYRTAEHVQTLSQSDGQPQNAFASSQIQLPAQGGSYQAPTPQQQQIAQPAPTANNFQPAPQNYQQPGFQQFGQPQIYNNQFNQGQFLQPPFGQQNQFGFPTAPTLPPPAQPQFPGFQNAGQQPDLNQQYANFGQPATQPQTSQVFNPFQPFLQQSYQSQQPQTPYNPFTFATLPPHTFAPFTPAPVTLPTMGTFPTFPTFPTHAPITQAPQPPVTQPTPAQNSYQQNGNNNYVQSGQSAQTPHQAIIVQPQRPRQLYNTQQQGHQQVQTAQNQYQVPQQPQAPYLQPARSNSIPTVQVGNQAQIGRSIDSAPVQLEKQAYIGKGAPPAFVDTCPKQPNWEPCISKDLANERFRNCCQRLGEGCSQLCNYDQSLTTLQLAVLTGRCPIAKVADMMICASGYEDASTCCQAYGVFEPGFEHCRPYCNPAAGLPNDGMLAEKYKCLGKLSQIQRCFYVSQRP